MSLAVKVVDSTIVTVALDPVGGRTRFRAAAYSSPGSRDRGSERDLGVIRALGSSDWL
jgi:hypothetical protein